MGGGRLGSLFRAVPDLFDQLLGFPLAGTFFATADIRFMVEMSG